VCSGAGFNLAKRNFFEHRLSVAKTSLLMAVVRESDRNEFFAISSLLNMVKKLYCLQENHKEY
jgi:hypothetical protein